MYRNCQIKEAMTSQANIDRKTINQTSLKSLQSQK